jgi:epoxyqueuosine reductase QueG
LDLSLELKEKSNTTLFGIADARAYAEKAPAGHRPADFMTDARSIVVLGERLIDLPLDGIPATRYEYTADFHMTNERLNLNLFTLSRFLQSGGARVFPVPYREMPAWNLEKRSAALFKLARGAATLPRVRELVNARLGENLSYRHMAVEAGLGKIGNNNLLLTPGHGARVRLVALLTDVELTPGRSLEKVMCQPDVCGNTCAKACPAGALTPGEPTDKAACLKYYLKLGIPGQSGLRCGLCVAKCPAYSPALGKED